MRFATTLYTMSVALVVEPGVAAPGQEPVWVEFLRIGEDALQAPHASNIQMFHSILLLVHGVVVHHSTLELLSQKLLATGHEIPPQVNVLEYAIDSIDSLDADRSSIFSIHGKDSSSLTREFQNVHRCQFLCYYGISQLGYGIEYGICNLSMEFAT
jgi:hypothetical protein